MADNLTGKRINRYLADSGCCSRREADRLIEAGLVKIDQKTAVLGDRVIPGMKVTVRGNVVDDGAERKYIVLYKPRGIVCTADEREPLNIVSYVDYPGRIYPVGRLDKQSEGLILMTSDGEIVNRLLKAAGGHEREYIVVIDRPVTKEFLRKLENGVYLEQLDVTTLPAKTRQLTQNSFSIVLTQGLNRQIRRMCLALGARVRSLKRIRIENISLGDMRPGQWRELTDEEKNELFKRISMPGE